jgi:apolipoprotein D and lipocalin family protein
MTRSRSFGATLGTLALAGALLAASASACAQAAAALQTIPSLTVDRYLGRWYEIAKFPNWFQKKCVSDTSADYSVTPEGSIRVLNQCRLQNGLMDQATGQARQVGESTSAQLKVRFAPAWLSFLPWVWGDYWVVDLDAQYELAAVSEPQREYLWILSRSPVVDEARYAALLSRLTALGLDVNKLEKTAHMLPEKHNSP